MAQSSSQRIASNTVILFVRMAALMVVNLYAVRVVLAALGAEDYGIFNVVAGVTTSTTFISGVLDVSIQRFYSVTVGEDSAQRLKSIFSTSLTIVAVLSVVFLILFETVGLWIINYWLEIPGERLFATNIIYQAAVFVFLCTFIQIPYTAAIFAHEDMNVFALISTVECVLKLIAALLIGLSLTDNLVFYGGSLLVVAVIVIVSYVAYARSHYDECHYKLTKDMALAKSIIKFSAWSSVGSFSGMCMTQGSAILLNIYFGPLANAAFAIATQIRNAFASLCNNALLAVRPQMMRSYAEKNNDYLNKLLLLESKFIYYTMLSISIPLIINMEEVLRLWLGAAEEQFVIFSKLAIIAVIVLALSNPITTIMQATGNIRNYHLIVESVTLLALPLAWLAFSYGAPAYYVFVPTIIVLAAAHFVRIIILRRNYAPFSTKDYIFSFAAPAAVVTLASLGASRLMFKWIDADLLVSLATSVISVLLTFGLAFTVGLRENEKRQVYSLVKSLSKK